MRAEERVFSPTAKALLASNYEFQFSEFLRRRRCTGFSFWNLCQ